MLHRFVDEFLWNFHNGLLVLRRDLPIFATDVSAIVFQDLASSKSVVGVNWLLHLVYHRVQIYLVHYQRLKLVHALSPINLRQLALILRPVCLLVSPPVEVRQVGLPDGFDLMRLQRVEVSSLLLLPSPQFLGVNLLLLFNDSADLVEIDGFVVWISAVAALSLKLDDVFVFQRASVKVLLWLTVHFRLLLVGPLRDLADEHVHLLQLLKHRSRIRRQVFEPVA